MGKKRLTQLLDKLEANQARDLQNTAAIFTVAQVAINELSQQDLQPDLAAIAALPPALNLIDQQSLLQQYGSYNGCRTAAKKQGIKFRRAPSWQQLIAAFSYAERLRQLAHTYLEAYPNPALQNVVIELRVE